MALTPGTRLGVYEVTALIGEGGMGQVYRATDTKLKRQVAIKILPASLATDPDRLARFQREAEVLASLNHPNIAAIHGLEESGGVTALVMELVEGDDLSQRIAKGAIPLDEALPIAKQIAEALDAAHEQGIIHRDLKPANIKVRADGTVKVLDFGLAKAMEPTAGGLPASASMSPTMMSPAQTSGVGVILGTAAYMAPEQAKGRTVDKRADIWAFGVVVYEMLTSRRAFAGEDITDTIVSVVTKEPDWTRLPPQTPQSVRTLLHRCLQKERRSRLHDIADARIEIEETLNRPIEPAAGTTRPPRPRLAWTVAAALGAALISVSTIAYLPRPVVDLPETRLQIVGLFSEPRPPVISPDGRTLVFAAESGGRVQLWRRSLGSLDTQPLAGTDNAELPFWSPDSRSLGFFANGKLKRVALAGGAVENVANAMTARGGTWNRDDVILFASGYSSGLFRVSASGGEVTPVTTRAKEESSHRFPQFLPDGRHFLYFVQGAAAGIYVGALDGGTRRLLDADGQASFAAPNALLFARESRLLLQPFDLVTLSVSGEPTTIAEQISWSSEVSNLAAFSVSDNHTLVYRAGSTLGAQRQLAWFDRSGKTIQSFAPDSATMVNPALSPDNTRVLFNRLGPGLGIWMLDAVRGNVTRVTATQATDVHPVWTPDGKNALFDSNDSGAYRIYQQPVGGGPRELVVDNRSESACVPHDASADGKYLLYVVTSPNTGWDIWATPLSGERLSTGSGQAEPAEGRKPFPVVATSFEERDPVFSPDGRWIAYQSDETGRFEVYAQAFPTSSGKTPISSNGGTQARWSRSGKEIFYIGPDSALMAVPVAIEGGEFRAGTPTSLFHTRLAGGALTPAPNKQQYDVSKDGSRFIMNTSNEEASTSAITVILNWKPPGR